MLGYMWYAGGFLLDTGWSVGGLLLGKADIHQPNPDFFHHLKTNKIPPFWPNINPTIYCKFFRLGGVHKNGSTKVS